MLAAMLAVSLILSPAFAEEKELPEAAQKDLKKLEGKWKAVKAVTDGNEETPKMDSEDVILEFKGRKLIVNGKEFMQVAAMDPSADPKCVDFKALIDQGGIRKDTTYEGIYKLDGDTLQLAIYIEGGANRPAKFESAQGSKVVVVTLKREKN